MIRTEIVNRTTDCDYCGETIDIGSKAYIDEQTSCVGCCKPCCRSAAGLLVQQTRQRLSIHGMRALHQLEVV